VNARHFNETRFKSAFSTVTPEVEIDTNIKVPLIIGGPIFSDKPYDLSISHVDDTSSFKSMEIAKITISYDDNTSEPRLAKIPFPLQVDAGPHEYYNTMA
jgi:hypothetical protein